jgi:hypothetical protein
MPVALPSGVKPAWPCSWTLTLSAKDKSENHQYFQAPISFESCWRLCYYNTEYWQFLTEVSGQPVRLMYDIETSITSKFLFFYIIHLLKSSTCLEHYPDRLQEVYIVIVYVQPLVSSLSAGDCPVHRLKKLCSLLTGAQDSHLKRVTIPEVAYIQLRRRPPEDKQGNAWSM